VETLPDQLKRKPEFRYCKKDLRLLYFGIGAADGN